jgi:pyruvate/2-oxoglutarate dehydrogenase complex dihydrolipoamide acyltransferase (E2) component
MIMANTEGKLLRWYDDVGALVEQGDVIADIQTADGIMRVTAPHSGRLTEMMALAGDSVQAGQVIGQVDAIDAPQSIGALIDPPAAERKLKPKEPKRKLSNTHERNCADGAAVCCAGAHRRSAGCNYCPTSTTHAHTAFSHSRACAAQCSGGRTPLG